MAENLWIPPQLGHIDVLIAKSLIPIMSIIHTDPIARDLHRKSRDDRIIEVCMRNAQISKPHSKPPIYNLHMGGIETM